VVLQADKKAGDVFHGRFPFVSQKKELLEDCHLQIA
jgi:hypothetical protein